MSASVVGGEWGGGVERRCATGSSLSVSQPARGCWIHRRWKLQYATSHRRVFTVRGSGGSGERVVCFGGENTFVTSVPHAAAAAVNILIVITTRIGSVSLVRYLVGNRSVIFRIVAGSNAMDREFSSGTTNRESHFYLPFVMRVVTRDIKFN